MFVRGPRASEMDWPLRRDDALIELGIPPWREEGAATSRVAILAPDFHHAALERITDLRMDARRVL
jgi:hypothetical protein